MKKIFNTAIICFFISVVSFPQITEYKVTPSDSADNLFGWSVFSSGDYAIVGAPISGDYGGEVYIFKHEAGNWIEKQILTASDSIPGSFFGKAVSMSGDYLIVGAPQNDDLSGTSSSDSICAAYIFKKEGEAWSEIQKLVASDGDTTDRFGYSVSISDQYAVIGAPRKDYTKGAAYIFKRNGVFWIEQQKISASDGVQQDYFGVSVSISGENVLVSSFYSAYIFRRERTNWIEYQKLIADGTDSLDFFGFSSSLSNDVAIVGAPGDDDSTGSAFIFRLDGNNWFEEQKLIISDDTSHGFAGWSVSIFGDYAILGSPFDNDFGIYSGSAYIFNRNISGWTEQYKLIASDSTPLDLFGWSVSISEHNAICGLPSQYNRLGGVAYIYSGFVVGVENDQNEIPPAFKLNQNYPNPFNPSTKIKYSIPYVEARDRVSVQLKVYDILGKEVVTLVNEEQGAGFYEIDFAASQLSSGIYFYLLQAGEFIQTKKMVLMR